ncbi:uncharacterized protein LOC128282105 [Gossypium arboreum]|uniref:uncharacterized protein LOC128282105 n=1 Tax=Gossypium arboreum TaxID=29729 RepID=UPI0022F18107|nr:uncharacterized protein LOC128282105 [Gossypium arboreum]
MREAKITEEVKGAERQNQERDIGSTYSYIACTVFKNFGILVESITSEVVVLSSLGQSVRVNKLFRDVPLKVQVAIFRADLIELPFGEFDLILGMDWLVKHRVSLDCATKRVVLRTEEDSTANVVADALSHKVMTDLRAMFARLSLFDDGSLLAELQVKPTWIEHIKGKQLKDELLGLRF